MYSHSLHIQLLPKQRNSVDFGHFLRLSEEGLILPEQPCRVSTAPTLSYR